MIALLCSVQAEAELLLIKTAIRKTTIVGTKSIIQGILAGQQILLCIGGIGKVNAAHAATLLFLQFIPEALIIFGIGGAYPSSGARIGDVAIATKEIAGDEGVMTPDGFKDAECIGIPLIRTATSTVFTTYPAPDAFLRRSQQALVSYQGLGAAKIHVGSFVTLSTCTGTSAQARKLEGRYHGLCENMEGAAAAQVAELHNIPWFELRGISNIVEDRNLDTWDIPAATDSVQRVIMHLLDFFAKQ